MTTTAATPASVSVIMPCLNSAKHVRASIESALGQTLHDIELIVVDNGSTDETLAIVASIKDPRIRVLRQSMPGVSAARNMGVQAAAAPFVAFLDSDDSWSPVCLARLHAALSVRPDAVLAYCGWQNVGLPGPRGQPFVPPDYETPEKRSVLFAGCRWPIHAALVRRRAVLEAGGFNTQLRNAEDYLLWLEVAGTRPIVRVPEPLAFYHFHGGVQASLDEARAALHQFEAQKAYVAAHPDFEMHIGKKNVREVMIKGLLKRAYDCYWRRDLRAARKIFRRVVREHVSSLRHWKYVLPALLPYSLHKLLLTSLRRF
jgi:glycosyltransferase involved in cell wall biosynthesis